MAVTADESFAPSVHGVVFTVGTFARHHAQCDQSKCDEQDEDRDEDKKRS